MFIVRWVWGSLFGTQCLVCLEPTLDIKQQGELARYWLEASLLGCYQDIHTQTHSIILSTEHRVKDMFYFSNKKHVKAK